MGGPRFNPNLLKVPLYIAGRSVEEVKEELRLDEVVKLASNESPVGPSAMAVAAAQQVLDEAHRYPGIAERALRRTLAEQLDPDLDEENIITGNGGTDVIHRITQAFVFDGGNTVMSRATFPMYRISTTTFGGTPRQVEPTSEYKHDLVEMARQINEDTRLVFLCSPNNPTGHVITQAEADAFMARVPEHVVVLFDEAYRDFVTDSDCADSLAYVKEGRNVLVLRSFSKSAGLANLRVGYAIGPRMITNYVRRTQLPFHTSAVALAAAAASLKDEDHRAQSQQAVVNGREFLYSALTELGLTCFPSQASFIVIVDPPREPEDLAQALLKQGVIVRAMTAFGMPNGIRVSVGSPAENRIFVAALQKVLEEKLSEYH
jgi:histidinol-phosphate aminotransferase